jgi:hypothetical protein
MCLVSTKAALTRQTLKVTRRRFNTSNVNLAKNDRHVREVASVDERAGHFADYITQCAGCPKAHHGTAAEDLAAKDEGPVSMNNPHGRCCRNAIGTCRLMQLVGVTAAALLPGKWLAEAQPSSAGNNLYICTGLCLAICSSKFATTMRLCRSPNYINTSGKSTPFQVKGARIRL